MFAGCSHLKGVVYSVQNVSDPDVSKSSSIQADVFTNQADEWRTNNIVVCVFTSE
jgi:hypothetical protein